MAVRPDFALTAENAADVAEIVRRLDGLPLAIELAAARIRLLSPAAMAQRLGDRLGLLAAGGRDLPERQRTLRGAIDWSHDLLDPEERRLFARLGVFAGGGPLETAESVCGIPGDEVSLDVIGGLERLAEQSLVRIGDDLHGDVRFTMLETIREYALEKLARAGRGRRRSATGTRRRSWRSRRRPRPTSADTTAAAAAQARLLDRLEDEHDNLRAALEHLIASGDTERAVGPRVRAVALLAHARPPHRGPDPRGPGAGDAAVDRRSRPGPACGPSRRPAASPTGRPTSRRRASTTGPRSQMARALGDEARDRQRALQLLLRAPARPRLRRVVRADARRGHGAPRRGAGDLDAPGRRARHGPGAVGHQRVLRLPRRGRARRGGGDPRARDLRAARRPVLGQLVEVHARLRPASCRATSGLAAIDLVPTLREFWASRDLSGVALTISGGVDDAADGRDARSTATASAAPSGAWSPRPASTSRHACRSPGMPDGRSGHDRPGPRGPRSSEGAAWTREEAVERTLALEEMPWPQEAPAPT